jgi:hypothetical protein
MKLPYLPQDDLALDAARRSAVHQVAIGGT